jgi:HSP20 family protein
MISERNTGPIRLGELEEIFEILVTSYSQKGGAIPTEGDLCWRPATDAYETKDTFVVQMDLAGMEPTGIEVLTDGEHLTVRGIRQDISPPGKKHFIKMEINVGPFIRRVPIPIPVDLRSAVARYRSGFLYVTFKKGRRRGSTRRHITVGE